MVDGEEATVYRWKRMWLRELPCGMVLSTLLSVLQYADDFIIIGTGRKLKNATKQMRTKQLMNLHERFTDATHVL